MTSTADDTGYCTIDPVGRPLVVPSSVMVDSTTSFDLASLSANPSAIAAYYAEHGYVVVRGVIPPALCAAANAAFSREVKGDSRPFYRLSGTPEPHRFTSNGFMLAGLRDVQSLDRRHSPEFRQTALDVLTYGRLQEVVAAVLGEPATMVQTMYFEGNPATPPHQDTYYLDAEQLGRMVAAWIATEDIAPGAGRFYVSPGSHGVELPLNRGDFNIVEHYGRYLEAVTSTLRSAPLACHAPALAQGDVLLWSAQTIHGSLPTSQPDRSRRSFTAHFIPERCRFLQWQKRVVRLEIERINGVPVHHPKNLNRVQHRLRYFAETRFPTRTAQAKQMISRRLLRR